MLSQVAIATWIAFCVPWAEPRLLAALVDAGSAGEPYLISDSAGWREAPTDQRNGIYVVRKRLMQTSAASAPNSNSEIYVGLAQIPASSLKSMQILPEHAIDKCTNLELGYSLFLLAYEEAGKSEKTPWKRLSVAYNYYRTATAAIDTPYAKRATDYLMSGRYVAPATMNDPLYHAVASEWGAGLANRYGTRQPGDLSSVLLASEALAQQTRKRY